MAAVKRPDVRRPVPPRPDIRTVDGRPGMVRK